MWVMWVGVQWVSIVVAKHPEQAGLKSMVATGTACSTRMGQAIRHTLATASLLCEQVR